MKTFNTPPYKKLTLLSAFLFLLVSSTFAQACATAQGNETNYGTNNTWIGYVYQGKNFDNYQGYVTEGNTSSPNFDESFGGGYVNYPTNGCSAVTDNFSVRYKLSQSFAAGNYTIIVGGDDGYRLSLDGGATWVINHWNDQSYNSTTYTAALSGATNLVFEYYESGGDNRVSFNITAICSGTGNPAIYGTGITWQGYIYQGMNFDMYKGSVTEPMIFDENFGSAGGTYNTNSCSITTYQFSARYRLQANLTPASYVITIGGDDGVRLSLDGGATWVINNWGEHSYMISSYTAALSGNYNMVLEYFQDAGDNRVSFSIANSTLPVTLTNWSVANVSGSQTESLLKWEADKAINFDHFNVQRSTDGSNFENIHTIAATTANGIGSNAYSYMDAFAWNGKVYYRLSMVDLDGTTTYSSIQVINKQGSQGIRIYPTVVEDGNVFVETTSSVHQASFEVFDMSGHRMVEKIWSLLEGRQQVAINGNGGTLPPGAYITRLSENGNVLAKQLIIVKK